MRTIKHRLYFLLLTCWILAFSDVASAQPYPERSIKIIIPFAAGGGGDLGIRLLVDSLGDRLGQRIIIENRPGANGVAAALGVTTAQPDGYTLALLGNINAIGQSLMMSAPYDLINDFVPITVVSSSFVIVATAPSSNLATIQELVALAKAKPGAINIGVGLAGTTQHLSAELFKFTMGLDLAIVPFRSSGDLLNAILRSDVDVGFELVAPVLSHLESNVLKPLAISSGERMRRLPGIPTFLESGVAIKSVASWSIIAAPARTPSGIIERLNKEMVDTLVSPEVQGKFEMIGSKTIGGTPQEARSFLMTEVERWKLVIAQAKIGRK